jgi:ABC-type spermidine/putrescine transport system permease subunit I
VVKFPRWLVAGGRLRIDQSLRTGRSGRPWRPDLPLPLAAAMIAPVAVLFGVLFFVPLARVIELSLTDPQFGLQRYREFFRSSADTRALVTTLEVSGIVTVISLIVGAIVAWTLRSTHSRLLRSLLWVGTIFPLWMSVVVLTYVFTILLQRHGIINEILVSSGVTDQPAHLLYNTGAVVVAMVYSLAPLAILPLYATFVNIDEDLIRAAESLGASRLRAIFSIAVPVALPAFLAAAVMVFVIALGFYITPTILGTPTHPFLGALIADQVYNQFDVAGASAGSSILLVIALGVVVVGAIAVGRQRLQRTLA